MCLLGLFCFATNSAFEFVLAVTVSQEVDSSMEILSFLGNLSRFLTLCVIILYQFDLLYLYKFFFFYASERHETRC